jgi:Skp family chaperone for outer membrane proteins
VRVRFLFLAAVGGTLAGMPAAAQEFFRCTTPDGKVTYQQAPCAKTDEQRKVDATPANTDYDASKREEVLRKGEEAGKRLEERAAKEAEERRLREEQRERERKAEEEAQRREAAREGDVVIYGGWPNRPVQPRPPVAKPPVVPPRPVPRTGK